MVGDDFIARLREYASGCCLNDALQLLSQAADIIEQLQEGKTMDEQTMKDYIEDLLQERAQMYEKLHALEANRDEWQALTLKWQNLYRELMTQLEAIGTVFKSLTGSNG